MIDGLSVLCLEPFREFSLQIPLCKYFVHVECGGEGGVVGGLGGAGKVRARIRSNRYEWVDQIFIYLFEMRI